MKQRPLPKRQGFLVRCNSLGLVNGKSHLWTGEDTACRMWSTNLVLSNKTYKFFSEPPTQLCSMCHPERYDMDLWIQQAVAMDDERPYTLLNEQG